MYGKGNNNYPVVSVGKASERCVWSLCLSWYFIRYVGKLDRIQKQAHRMIKG